MCQALCSINTNFLGANAILDALLPAATVFIVHAAYDFYFFLFAETQLYAFVNHRGYRETYH